MVETKVDTLIGSVKSIDKKIDDLDKKFAAKWVQTVVAGLIAAILLGFLYAAINFFIPNSEKPRDVVNIPSTNQTSGSASTTPPSASANATSHSDTTKPSDSQTSTDSGGVQITLPKVTP